MEFQIGDRVIGKGIGRGDMKNVPGTVKSATDEHSILVEFDENIRGHNGNRNCKDGHGWFCDIRQLKLAAPIDVKIIAEVEVEAKL